MQRLPRAVIYRKTVSGDGWWKGVTDTGAIHPEINYLTGNSISEGELYSKRAASYLLLG